jgi:hypothetical protein
MPDNKVDVLLSLRGGKKFRREADASGRSLRNIGDDTDHVVKQSGRAEKSWGKSRRGLVMLGGAARTGGLAMGAGLAYGLAKSTAAFEDSRKVAAQTGAAIKSTGGVANVSASHVNKMGTAMMQKTGIDDEQIKTGANMLLTFRNIRNEAGKSNKVFDRSTQAALDMSVAMGTDTRASALQLGKALNDPSKGLTRLQRVGVTFSDQQKKQIEGFEKTGQRAKAQGVILNEVTKEFGGSAAAQATPLSKMKTQAGELLEMVGGWAAPYVDRAAKAANRFFIQLQTGRGLGGKVARDFRQGVTAVKGFIAPFTSGKQRISGFGSTIRNLSTIFNATFPVLLAVVRAVVPVMVSMIRNGFNVLRGIIQVVASLIRGDWGGAWRGIKLIVSSALKFMLASLKAVTTPFRVAGGAIGRAIWGGLKAGGTGVVNFFIDRLNSMIGVINTAIKAFNKLPGHGDVGTIGTIHHLGGGGGGGRHTPYVTKGAGAIGGAATGGVIHPGGSAMVGDGGLEVVSNQAGKTIINPVAPNDPVNMGSSIAGHIRRSIQIPVYLHGRQIALATAEDTDRRQARS